FITLDCADVERLSFARPFFRKAKTTICIDHHATNPGFAMYNLIDPDASSTSEMVLRVIEALVDVDSEIATAIYTGIVTDTGGFKYSSTGRSTMEAAVRLMETGIPFTDIYNEVMHKHSFEASKALGLALGASKLVLDGKLVYTCLTREMLVAAGADSAEMDNVVEYLMSTKGAEVALFLYERHQTVKPTDAPEDPPPSSEPKEGTKKIKVSMRSRSLDIGQIAASLGGGGHRMAAGCAMVGTMESVLEQVLKIVEPELLARL
ncbi:MAG: DHHA1 domain-containing protein, partial [Defluviitaleaceae bacterium]|nr:DHHA1 domain-containing protein [Defluviitaleaceae bacterium]